MADTGSGEPRDLGQEEGASNATGKSTSLEADSSRAHGTGGSGQGAGEADARVEGQCDQIWQQLQQLQDEVSKESAVVAASEEDCLPMILAQKEKLLQAQLEAIRQQEIQPLPSDAETQRVLLTSELERSVSELEQVLSLVISQRKEAADEISRLDYRILQHEQIKAVVMEKLEHPEQLQSSTVREIEEKTQKMEKYKQDLLKKMAEFIETHFPQPDADTVKVWRKKHPQPPLTKPHVGDYIPLKEVLQKLMNQCMDSPHDPYITLTSAHWPPYIEMLLRYGIVQRHKDQDSLIKLTPFNL